MREVLDPSGVLVMDKPAGMTSHDVVDRVRRVFGWKKVGHAGTLDPLATGVLILLIGQATRAQERFLNDDKEYRGRMKLGIATSTHDAEGEVVSRAEGPIAFERARIEEAFAAFRGEQRQMPPMVSAVKHKGKPLYKYARKGQEIEREARTIQIRRLEILAIEGDEIEFEVHCSKGTYVRTLAHDIGARLGVGAHLKALRRTRSGPFRAENAISLDALVEGGPGFAFEKLIPLSQALPPAPPLPPG
jgi:tRNA pseudouridine55 synthase